LNISPCLTNLRNKKYQNESRRLFFFTPKLSQLPLTAFHQAVDIPVGLRAPPPNSPSLLLLKFITIIPEFPFKMFPRTSAPFLMLVLIPQAYSYTNVNDKTELTGECYQCTTHREALQSWHEGKGCERSISNVTKLL